MISGNPAVAALGLVALTLAASPRRALQRGRASGSGVIHALLLLPGLLLNAIIVHSNDNFYLKLSKGVQHCFFMV